jgi:hypothetical protein
MVEGKGDPMVRAEGRTKPDRKWYPENFDWYLKWGASILIMVSLAMRSAGVDYRMYDLIFGFVGVLLWTWVSIIWRDRALIMLNAISAFMLGSTILRELPL